LNLKIRHFEDVGSGYYVEVVQKQTGFHTELYKGPIYPSVYICKTEEELDAAIEKAFKRDFGLWGSDEDY
jgi:hypothetical protein